ncbi:hypothetical protein [Clostridium sp. OS1-26]|uniref:hypothetical protein n=1 Tax=Clostridium sp. OS1-26 TaxID=3070681 RepID=UPI0027E1C4A1|nr:hypothetical protein [Clostridium sp. OS1-26]WML36953.1 hypothetical protein RCG18_10220 [Clostridium sp. OS1-26]
MKKSVKRCKEEGVVCKKLHSSIAELELVLDKMREHHKIAQKSIYGYMAEFAGLDVEGCACELKNKLKQLRIELANTCYKCKGYNDYIHELLIEAEMFVARQAFAEAEARFEESVGVDKYMEMFYE